MAKPWDKCAADCRAVAETVRQIIKDYCYVPSFVKQHLQTAIAEIDQAERECRYDPDANRERNKCRWCRANLANSYEDHTDWACGTQSNEGEFTRSAVCYEAEIEKLKEGGHDN